jgi:hypothetical protein
MVKNEQKSMIDWRAAKYSEKAKKTWCARTARESASKNNDDGV